MHSSVPNYLEGVTVIIADDSVSQRDRNTAVAIKYGMKVVSVVDTGRLAVEAASYYKPMVALLDIVMPDMTGIEASQLIKKSNPSCKVILVTSTAQKDAINLDLSVADAVLVKPFPDEWFLQRVYAVVRPMYAKVPVMNNDG